MIATYIPVILATIIGLVIAAFCIVIATDPDTQTGIRVVVIITAFIITVAIVATIYFGLLQDPYVQQTITVYDMEGDIISEYSGKFDVESYHNKIEFTDENGKQRIVYFTNENVVIEEN